MTLHELGRRVATCRGCPRLVSWREEVARTRRAAYRDEPYWGRGVPGMGDAAAALVVVGLAPGAHGANRTGRPFTGDGAGTVLFGALERGGFLRDGALVGCWLTNVVKCVPPGNAPDAGERTRCGSLLAEELALLPAARVLLALGATAWHALARLGQVRPRPHFGHGAELQLPAGGPLAELTLLASYHPSRQNTNTGRLTTAMLDGVVARAAALLPGGAGQPSPQRSSPSSPQDDARVADPATAPAAVQGLQ